MSAKTHWGGADEPYTPHECADREPGGFRWSSLGAYVAGHGGAPTVEAQTDADFLARGPRLNLGASAFREMLTLAGGDPSRPPSWLAEIDLLEAVAAGDAARADELLRAGADPDAAWFGRNPLGAALVARRGDLVLRLLDAGARADRRREGDAPLVASLARLLLPAVREMPERDRVFDALVAAGLDLSGREGGALLLSDSDPWVVRRLLAGGADVNMQDARGGRPLHHASGGRGGDAASVELLLAAGADVNAVNADGWTALRTAVEFGNAPALRALLAAGADPTIASKRDGVTPLARARALAPRSDAAREILTLLERAGG